MYYIIIPILLIIVFIIWRNYATSQGGIKRDEKIFNELEDVYIKVKNNEKIELSFIEKYASYPHLRYALYFILKDSGYLDVWPQKYNTIQEQVLSSISIWMMHPNELQGIPEHIEIVKEFKKSIDGTLVSLFVLKYKMPKEHWSYSDKWKIGIVGPIPPDYEKYSFPLLSFCKGDDFLEENSPEKLVNWWLDMLKQKGMIKDYQC